MDTKNQFILPVIIAAASLIITALIVVGAWKSNYKSNQTITVTGSAKKQIVSDLAVLKGSLVTEALTAEDAYRKLLSQKPELISYLTSKGFPEDKIEFSPISSYPVYEIGESGYQTGRIRAYTYNQRIEIQSSDVNKVKETSLEIASLIEKGVSFNLEMPEYHYSKLAELKIEIQAEAAKDAMVRAEKIAAATGRELGPISNARMGVLQITPLLSNQISDYGINDLSSIEKEITAVVSASFEID